MGYLIAFFLGLAVAIPNPDLNQKTGYEPSALSAEQWQLLSKRSDMARLCANGRPPRCQARVGCLPQDLYTKAYEKWSDACAYEANL